MTGKDGARLTAASAPGTARVDQQVMRAVNRSLIEALFRDGARLSRAEVAKRTGLAKPTVSAIIAELVGDGVLREAGSGPRLSSGRPPLLLEYDVSRQFVVGLHVWLRRVTVLVADSGGNTVARIEHEVPGRGDNLASLKDAVHAGLAAAGAPRSRLGAVGVCVPGLIDLSTGTCLIAPRLGWRDVPVRAGLERALGVPVFPLNTMQAAVVAEAEEGAAAGAGDVVLYYFGPGVGAGVLAGGRILHGAAGLTGEIGHCAVPGVTTRCACGKQGCLETVASSTHVAEAAGLQPSTAGPEGDAAAVVEAALSGRRGAVRALQHAGEALGVGASWMVNLFNPQVLVLAGPLVDAGDLLVGPLREKLLENAIPTNTRGLKVVPSALGEEAFARGAVLLALQRTTAHYRVVFGAA